MRRKIAAITAAVLLMQGILPVCTQALTPNTGMRIHAAEMTECNLTETADTEITDAETEIQETDSAETKTEHEIKDTESDTALKEKEALETEVLESEAEMEVKETEVQDTEPETEAKETEIMDTEPETEVKETEIQDSEPDTEVKETESLDKEADVEIKDTETDIEMQETEISDTEYETEYTDMESDIESMAPDEDSGLMTLSAEKGLLHVNAFCTDESAFEENTVLQLQSMEEMAEREGNPEEAVLYRDMLLDLLYEQVMDTYISYQHETEWSDDLRPYLYEAVKEAMLTFEPLEVQFLYTDGSSYDPGEVQFEMAVRNKNIHKRFAASESFVFPVWYTDSLQLRIPSEEDYHTSVSGDAVHLSLDHVYRPSFLAITEFDRAAIENLSSVINQLKETETEQSTEQNTEQNSEQTEDGMVYAFTQQGTPCKSSSAYKKVTSGSRTFSSAYTFLRGTSKSVCSMWYDSSLVMKGYQESTGIEYLMPKSSSAKGKFGFRITNVGYSTSARCNLDLYVTVTNFNSYSLDNKGNKVSNVYPFIHMNKSLYVHFQGGLPDFELQCDIVKTGTTEKVPGNYRFMWNDIDSAQRYGFKPLNGKLDARYCLTTSSVNCGTETKFSTSYYMVYGKAGQTEDTDDTCSVLYETSSMSSYKIYVGQRGDGTAAYDYSASTIKNRYNDAADGVYNYTAKAMLGWDGKAFGPTELPSPLMKYVSNNGSSWNTSNTLPSVTSEYWYAMELFVPQETSEYYYSQFKIEDVLPAGVDYVGSFSAQKIETGSSVSYFSAANASDTLTISASSSSLNSSAFYGFTYLLKFKVKMDPSETTASYSGTTAAYTLKNQAKQTGKHRTDSAVSTTLSNTVTTAASENRPSETAPEKKILTASGEVTEKELAGRSEAIQYEITQKIPSLTNAWRLASFELKDVLENGLTAERISLYQNDVLRGQWTTKESGISKAGWTCSISGQTIRIIAPGGLSNDYYGGTVRMVLDVKVKDGADLSAYVISGTPELRKVEIPNLASSVFNWKNGTPASVTKTTNKVLIRFTEQVLTKSRITLTKSINAEEIVWAHGNPTFTFCVEGTDLAGNTHRYYDTVEFRKEHTSEQGTVTQSAVFELPSGSYRAYETNVIRYRLTNIDGLQNGQAAGVGVTFHVTADKHGKATFHNGKTTDEKLSDTAFIRNVIIP